MFELVQINLALIDTSMRGTDFDSSYNNAPVLVILCAILKQDIVVKLL